MSKSANLLRNAGFSRGGMTPEKWTWRSSGGHVCLDRCEPGAPGRIEIRSTRSKGSGFLSQSIRCKPGEFYLVEATLTCSLVGPDETAGVVLRVQALSQSRPVAPPRMTPALHRATTPTVVRTYFEAPPGSDRLEFAVGVENAKGRVELHTVGVFSILAPEECSHPLALPPPTHTQWPNVVARSVCVCSESAATRPITTLMRDFYGPAQVATCLPRSLRNQIPEADAMLLPDAAPPPLVRSVASLVALAERRIVVISLPAFARLAGAKARLRRVAQEDDPICARIEFADACTRGFALHDTFTWSWSGQGLDRFVQNQLRKTKALAELCAKHGLVTRLSSMVNQETTTGHPVCLSMQTSRGALFVLDVEPVESIGSTMNEPAIAMYFLLGVLGRTQNNLGQFSVPVHYHSSFRELVREAALRLPEVVVHDENVPAPEVRTQLVTIGKADESFGLPMRPKPVVLVRSGLQSGDAESVYGCLTWFKQLVRMPPHVCPYARQLGARFRLAWIPCMAPWEPRDGWRRCYQPPEDPMELDFDEDGKLAALIDVVSRPVDRVRLVVHSLDREYRHLADWLPRVFASFQPGTYFAPLVADGEPFGDRDRLTWQTSHHVVQVAAEPASFADDAHAAARSSGALCLRIEVPGSDADFVNRSVERTDLVATLLEQTLGLLFGLIAVNRTTDPIHLDGFAPVAPGEALIVDANHPIIQRTASRAG